jgi:hypothetical protein
MFSTVELGVVVAIVVAVYYSVKSDYKSQLKDIEIFKNENKCLYAHLYCTQATQGSYDPQCIRDCQKCLDAARAEALARYHKGL